MSCSSDQWLTAPLQLNLAFALNNLPSSLSDGRRAPWGGLIQTDMGEQTFVSRVRNIGTNDVEVARRQAMSRHPISRLGVPDDIAKGIVFLASDDAGFMTGAGLVIDGGSTAQ
jgi:Enoyl-(Acyl carrier protein) reductase